MTFCFGPTLWIAVATNMSNCDVIHNTTHEQRQTCVSANFHTLPGLHSIQHENFLYNCARTTTQAVHQILPPSSPPTRVPLSRKGHAAKTPWEPDLAVTNRLNHRSCSDRSAHLTFLNPPKGFPVAPLGERPFATENPPHDNIFMEAYTSVHSVASAEAVNGRDRVVLPENTLVVGRLSKDHVVPVTNTCTIVSFIGGKQPSPCCSSSSHGPGATAKRSTHFGFCL